MVIVAQVKAELFFRARYFRLSYGGMRRRQAQKQPAQQEMKLLFSHGPSVHNGLRIEIFEFSRSPAYMLAAAGPFQLIVSIIVSINLAPARAKLCVTVFDSLS